jgi:hypothetical protein
LFLSANRLISYSIPAFIRQQANDFFSKQISLHFKFTFFHSVRAAAASRNSASAAENKGVYAT